MNEIIEKMVSVGEFIIINNSYQYLHKEFTDILSSQLITALSKKDSVLGYNIMKKNNKILVINCVKEDDYNFLDLFVEQTKNSKENYNNVYFLNISPKTIMNASDIDEYTSYIENSDYDIIFWNNINNIQEFFNSHFKEKSIKENPLDHTLFIIRKISGMRTKIISHLYSNILDKDNFQRVNNIGIASITLTHNNIIEGFRIEFENKYNHKKSISEIEYKEENSSFILNKVSKYDNNIKVQ